ncbi:MAG: ATP synthase F0 subunit C [Oscillospiraceae bacterium]|nr:ATP synthase F0 subunit C [Oscillospiraceae bacterium]
MDPLALIIIAAHAAAVVALFNGFLTTFGQSRIAVAAIESIARQPEAADSIRTAMFVGLAMAETSGIYGLLIAIVILFANPLIPIYIGFVR